jgi:hypothetical protein
VETDGARKETKAMTFTDWILPVGLSGCAEEEYAVYLANEAWKASQRNTMELIAGSSWENSPLKHLWGQDCRNVVEEINKVMKGLGHCYVYNANGVAVVSSRSDEEVDVGVELLANRVFEAI